MTYIYFGENHDLSLSPVRVEVFDQMFQKVEIGCQ